MRRSHSRRVPNWAIGLLLVVILAAGAYLAFTKNVPWGGGTEVTAVFRSAQVLRPNTPVRIAGVEVGEVTEVETLAASDRAEELPTSESTANGSGIQLARCNGGWAQQFHLTGADDLLNPATGKCVDVTDAATGNGARLQLWDCAGTSNQKWRLR